MYHLYVNKYTKNKYNHNKIVHQSNSAPPPISRKTCRLGHQSTTLNIGYIQ